MFPYVSSWARATRSYTAVEPAGGDGPGQPATARRQLSPWPQVAFPDWELLVPFLSSAVPSVYIVSVFLDILVPNTQENLGKTALLPGKQSWVLLYKRIFNLQESQSHAGCRTGLSHVHGPPQSPTHYKLECPRKTAPWVPRVPLRVSFGT